ncbi:MAG: succinate dehydrogenase, cytochrome b556 subunit [Woeseia sp.]
MNNVQRPLSPHLSIYRWPITMTMSILHRVSGVLLSLGFILFAVWLMAAANGAETYDRVTGFMESLLGRLLLIVLSAAFFFHLASGLRHLIWDMGFGFEIRQANAGSWAIVVSTVLLTLLYWLVL